MKTHEINKIRPFSALIDACWWEPYSLTRLLKDAIAGVTVGIIAIPLAMALAIASGVPPQYGLYTAAIAGIVIAVSGGSRYSVSGPTAAFVVILYPVSQQFGLAGLLVATLISGVFLLLMGLARFGRLIEYIPLPVTLGFTSGIAITIATMRIKDFFGLQLAHTPKITSASCTPCCRRCQRWISAIPDRRGDAPDPDLLAQARPAGARPPAGAAGGHRANGSAGAV